MKNARTHPSLGTRVFGAAVLCALLTRCDIRDELEIRADGSGTYRATVTVERLVGAILDRVRAQARQEGFRVVDEGATSTTRFLTVQKEFTNIQQISDHQSNFDLKVEDKLFRRRYLLHATLGGVSGASFDRQFVIRMPAAVTSSSDGRVEGQRVVWYCANGGTIDVVAEQFRLPLTLILPALAGVGVVAAIVILVLIRMSRRGQARASEAPSSGTAPPCRTCRQPLPAGSRYCPRCGDFV